MVKNLILYPPEVFSGKTKDMTSGMTLDEKDEFYSKLDRAHLWEQNARNTKSEFHKEVYTTKYNEIIGELYGKESKE